MFLAGTNWKEGGKRNRKEKKSEADVQKFSGQGNKSDSVNDGQTDNRK